MRDCESAGNDTGRPRSNVYGSDQAEASLDESDVLSSGKFYGQDEFYPKEIITQIVVIQASYYACLSLFVLIVFGPLGYSRTPRILFRPQYVAWANERGGRVLLFAHLIVAAIMAFCVATVVERTKKCLDFVVTLHFLHCVVCYLTSGFTHTSLTFWVLEIVCVSITTLLAEYLCMKTELQEIVLRKKQCSIGSGAPTDSSVHTSARRKPSKQVIRPRPETANGSKSPVVLELGSVYPPLGVGAYARPPPYTPFRMDPARSVNSADNNKLDVEQPPFPSASIKFSAPQGTGQHASSSALKEF